jgi:hypothetical protein
LFGANAKLGSDDVTYLGTREHVDSPIDRAEPTPELGATSVDGVFVGAGRFHTRERLDRVDQPGFVLPAVGQKMFHRHARQPDAWSWL